MGSSFRKSSYSRLPDVPSDGMASQERACSLSSCNSVKQATITCSCCLEKSSFEPQSGPDNSRYYCDHVCRSLDAPNHFRHHLKTQHRKALYNAGELLQGLFYIFREQGWETPLSAVTIEGNKMYLTRAPFARRTFGHPANCLYPFPSDLFHDESDEQAALVHYSCTDALAFMHDLMKHYLSEISQKIRELEHFHKDPIRECISLKADGSKPSEQATHQVILLKTTHSGDKYVVDLSGAQYGYYNSITPWDEYRKSRIAMEDGRLPFGSSKKLSRKECKVGTHAGETARAFVYISIAMHEAVQEWEKKEGFTKPMKLLQLPPDEFDAKMTELLEFVEERVKYSVGKFRTDRLKSLGEGTSSDALLTHT